jgi:diguanylate cyclase (GGDEF)-like protein
MASEYRKSHYRFILMFMLCLCAMSIMLTIGAVRNTRQVHAVETYNEIYEIKKVFLKNTVQNMVRTIENLYQFHTRTGELYRDRLFTDIDRLYAYNPVRFATRARELLVDTNYGDSLFIRFTDTRDNTELYSLGSPDPESSQTRTWDRFALTIGISSKWIDERTVAAVREIIYQQEYENGGYIWVNEVHDWNGGPDYATRRIHANLRDSEGTLLDTATTDVAGNTPYLTELEGVRKNGEVFFTYFFRRMESRDIGEKITYATLYPRYNWIVAMGYYLDDVQVYIDRVEEASDRITGIIVFITVLSNCALFVFAFFLLSRRENRYFLRTRRQITEESNIDPLTGIFNRRVGNAFLEDAFRSWHETGATPALFMVDIDDFKPVNDKWGHACGDEVLRTTVQAIRDSMRLSDKLIRWGGEEFLVVCPGLSPEGSYVVGEKFREAVMNARTANCDQNERREIAVTVSIGTGFFAEGDHDPFEAVNRADLALYRAKKAGKNCVR